VDDEAVAGGPAQDLLVDASFHEALQESLLPGSDDDQIRTAFVGKTDDPLARGSHDRYEVSGEIAPTKAPSRLFGLGLGSAGCLGGVLDIDGCGSRS
jgi:hypothetical protein